MVLGTQDDDIIRPATDSDAIANPFPLATREDDTQNNGQNGVDENEELPEAPTIDVSGDGDLPETTTVEQDAEPQPIAKTSRRGRPKTAESQENGITKSKQTADQTRKRSSRQSQVNGSDPPDEDTSIQDGQQRVSRARGRRGLESQSTAESELEVDRELEQEEPVIDSSSSKRGRRRKEREQPGTAEIEPEVNHEPEQEGNIPESSSTKRGRKPSQPEQEQQDEEQNNEPTQKAPRGRRKRGRPSTAEIVEAEELREEEDTAQTRNKSKGKNREVEPDERPVDATQERTGKTQRSKDQARRKQQPQEIGKSSRRRGRPSLGKGQEPQPEAENTETTETRAEAITEPDQPAKRRRGRPSAGATEDTTTSGQRTKRRREQDESQEPRRREGAVAITVHRLANTHILDSIHANSDPSDDEQDSTDELETAGKKFPSRNGVNAADVLSQICKEILDKQLKTLDNNIANDAANQAKRSEYARQRKAIEAYGTQLEGRLFELSELLDSNFSLGVQLKKAKREAAEMRNRLLDVRQQRHEITLRMDEVRRKHGEEENAKMVGLSSLKSYLHNTNL